MRALVVGGSPEGRASLAGSLAQSADIVIAVDSGGSLCLAAGVVPTVLVGDVDSLSAADASRLEAAGVPFEVYPAEKDVTDLDLAIDHARRAHATSVVATGVLGARIDHSLGSIGTLARAADLRPTIEEEHVSACVLDAGYRSHVEIRGEGHTISVIAVCGAALVSVDGVRWPLSAAELQPLSTLGISNVITEPFASVEVREGTVLVVAPALSDGRATFSLED